MRPVLAPPSWENTLRTAPQLFPRGQLQSQAAAHVPNRLRVFSGTANPALAQEVACYLGLDLGSMKIKRFADGEIYVQVGTAAVEVVNLLASSAMTGGHAAALASTHHLPGILHAQPMRGSKAGTLPPLCFHDCTRLLWLRLLTVASTSSKNA